MGRPSHRSTLWLAAALALPAGGCTRASPPSPTASGTIRERVAALALRQTDFGAISFVPVRFEHSRIAGPFEDGGRTLYCVTSRMLGRSFGKAERAKLVIRDEAGLLKVEDDDDACQGQRTEPFPELEAAGNRAG